MTFVITGLCDGCKSTACLEVCPVDCIYGLKSEVGTGQLYIHPEECIDCSACVPACPWSAIFADYDVPLPFEDYIRKNADLFRSHTADELTINPDPIKPNPTPKDVSENNKKHGFGV